MPWLEGNGGMLTNDDKRVLEGRLTALPADVAARARTILANAPTTGTAEDALLSDPTGRESSEGGLKLHQGRYLGVSRSLQHQRQDEHQPSVSHRSVLA